MFALPGQKGFFELKTEGGQEKGRGSRGTAALTRSLVVYFYQKDGTTELSPAPTDVAVKVGSGGDRSSVPLAPQANGGFATGPGRFPAGFRGQLTATINGEAVETTFVAR